METTSYGSLRQIPAGIWVLGLVSMLMDISSEMIHSLPPLFMVTTLGANVLAWANDFRAVFLVAAIPGCLAVALLWFGLKGPPRSEQQPVRVNPVRHGMVRQLPRAYWAVVGIGTVFMMARFSEAFLVLRAEQVGVALALVPLVMNIVYVVSADPLGKLSDRMSHHALLTLGLLALWWYRQTHLKNRG